MQLLTCKVRLLGQTSSGAPAHSEGTSVQGVSRKDGEMLWRGQDFSRGSLMLEAGAAAGLQLLLFFYDWQSELWCFWGAGLGRIRSGDLRCCGVL
jgi:hypothetical protein